MIYNFKTINDNKMILNEFYKKDELLNIINSLTHRDFYILDEDLGFKISQIITRNNVILIKMNHIRCIIKKTKAYFVLPKDITLVKDIEVLIMNIASKNINKNNIFFEFIILESIFNHISIYFDNKIEDIAPYILNIRTCSATNKKINNKELVNIQKTIIDLHSTVKDVYDRLKYINNLKYGKLYEFNLHNSLQKTEYISQILETYENQYEENYDDVEKMKSSLDITLKNIEINYANTRNKIARFDVNLTIFMVGLTIANLISSIFGMNLKNKLEKDNNSFYILSGSLIPLICIIYFIVKKLFNRI